MKYILICLFFFLSGCNNSQTLTPTESSDSAIKAIDPKGTTSDTLSIRWTSRSDSENTGVTH